LPVEAEEDLRDRLLATRLCSRRIALVTLEQRHDLRFPRRYRVRILRGDPALYGGGRNRGGLIWKRLRRGGRRCRGTRLLALRGWDLLGRGSTATSGLGAGLISGGGSSTGFDSTFSSTFSFSSRFSTGLLGDASGITRSGPGGISVCRAAGAAGHRAQP